VQGPFSRRVLCLDQVKVIQGNKSPFFADSASSRAFFCKSNRFLHNISCHSTLSCSFACAARAHVCQHLQSWLKTLFALLFYQAASMRARFGIKLPADVQLFDQQVVEDALTAALNLPQSNCHQNFLFPRVFQAHQRRSLRFLACCMLTTIWIRTKCFPENQSSLADMFTGLQIIKKFLFQRFSQVKKHPSIFVSFSFA